MTRLIYLGPDFSVLVSAARLETVREVIIVVLDAAGTKIVVHVRGYCDDREEGWSYGSREFASHEEAVVCMRDVISRLKANLRIEIVMDESPPAN